MLGNKEEIKELKQWVIHLLKETEHRKNHGETIEDAIFHFLEERGEEELEEAR